MSPVKLRATVIAGRIHVPLYLFVEEHKLGFVTLPDGGFVLFPNRQTVVAPDVAFIRRERLPAEIDWDDYVPVPPDLAVEVLSPSNTRKQVAEKVELYLAAGVPLVWVFRPRTRGVTVHRPGLPPLDLGIADELDGEDVLPGFRLKIADVYRQ